MLPCSSGLPTALSSPYWFRPPPASRTLSSARPLATLHPALVQPRLRYRAVPPCPTSLPVPPVCLGPISRPAKRLSVPPFMPCRWSRLAGRAVCSVTLAVLPPHPADRGAAPPPLTVTLSRPADRAAGPVQLDLSDPLVPPRRPSGRPVNPADPSMTPPTAHHVPLPSPNPRSPPEQTPAGRHRGYRVTSTGRCLFRRRRRTQWDSATEAERRGSILCQRH